MGKKRNDEGQTYQFIRKGGGGIMGNKTEVRGKPTDHYEHHLNVEKLKTLLRKKD